MYMRAFVYRFVYVGVVSLGIALGAAFQQPVAHAAASQPASDQAAVAAPAPLPIVTLSTVHVHADAARTPVAKPVAPARVATAVAPDLVSSVASDHRGGSVSTLRLDMPYYSFGKMLPRVGKE
ncbi:MAG TPA: hypothetical protein VFI49_10555 [Rudaea sp.]|nr:hypothetical protein [Rudaea sp.]